MQLPQGLSPKFTDALVPTLKAEGPGGTAEKNDPGGLTVFGITLNDEPTWTGWPLAHQLIAAGSSPATWWDDAELMGHVAGYYNDLFEKLGLEALNTPELLG